MNQLEDSLRNLWCFITDPRALKSACTLVLAGLLAGCWMSETPLIGSEQASEVAFAGPYRPDKESDLTIEVTANDDGSYSLIDNKGEGFTGFFMALDGGWYVVQQDFKEIARQSEVSASEGSEVNMTVEEGQGPYLYTLMRFEGADLAFHLPDCDEGTQAVAGVSLDTEAQQLAEICSISNLEALLQAAPAYIARIEAGEIEEGPSYLRSIAGKGE